MAHGKFEFVGKGGSYFCVFIKMDILITKIATGKQTKTSKSAMRIV